MHANKQELERKRAALTAKIVAGIDSTRDTERGREIAKDPYGAASQSHDDELALTRVDALVRELRQIERALADIEAGRYGICQECGEAIAPARLRALPFATCCVVCQSRREQGMPAGRTAA